MHEEYLLDRAINMLSRVETAIFSMRNFTTLLLISLCKSSLGEYGGEHSAHGEGCKGPGCGGVQSEAFGVESCNTVTEAVTNVVQETGF